MLHSYVVVTRLTSKHGYKQVYVQFKHYTVFNLHVFRYGGIHNY